jgi:uncharacterized protein (TIGR02453 family)
MLEPQTLKFLTALKKNNNKPWFDAHRPQYEAAKIDFQNFIQLVIDDFGRKEPVIADNIARNCIFRINRDIRFSKDKTPYKTNLGAIVTKGGRKSPLAGYYFQVEPGNSFIAGGLWMPDNVNLKKVRQEIDYNWDEFQHILKEKKFKSTFKDLYKGKDISLSVMPKGYPKDHVAIDYLKLKSFIVETHFQDEELTKSSLHKKTVAAFEAMQPLVYFINRALED